MGKHSEKKAIARKDRVNRIGIPVIIGVNALYVLLQFFVIGETSTFHYAALAVTTVCYFIALGGIAQAAFNNTSVAIYTDIFIVTALAQLGSLYTDKAWYLLLSIPAYLLYGLAKKCCGTLSMMKAMMGGMNQGGGEEDEKGRKRKEKKEKKEKRKIVRG